jgi:hypothetical protein
VVVGSGVLMTVWLAVGVLGVVAGLLWLRASERSRRASVRSALVLPHAVSSDAAHDSGEPDALAG